MGENTSATSDLDEEPEPIVAVRDQKRWQIACVLIALAVVILYLVFIFTAHLLVPEWLAKMGLWPSDTAACFCALLLSVIQIQIFLLAKNRYAEFAVWKDGLTLKTVRIGPKGSIQRRRDIGFYSWKEVSCCSWSHFDPDKLIVQLRSTTTRNVPSTLFGTVNGMSVTIPPMYFFYRVPQRFHGNVEKAIRACGKWAA